MSGVPTEFTAGNSYLWKDWKIFPSHRDHLLYFHSGNVVVDLPKESYGYFRYLLGEKIFHMSPWGPKVLHHEAYHLTNLQRSIVLVDPSSTDIPVVTHPLRPYLKYGNWLIWFSESKMIITNHHYTLIAEEQELTLPGHLSGFTVKSKDGEIHSYGEAIL